MAQFSVYRNKDARDRSAFPFLVDIQSDLLGELQSRVVIPLTRVTTLTRKPVAHLMPTVQFEGDTYVLMTQSLAAISRSDLGRQVGSIAEQRDTIVAALDFLFFGF